MSHPNPFAFVLTSILLLSACGADNSDVELTENQKVAVAERIAPAGHVFMEGQSITPTVWPATTQESLAPPSMAMHQLGL